jgi:hypothetical protein
MNFDYIKTHLTYAAPHRFLSPIPSGGKVITRLLLELFRRLEAAIGIEPMNKGFAEIFSHHS